MLIKAAINGGRTRAEHPGVPLTPEAQAGEAAAAVAAGAGAIHVHARDSDGRESLALGDIARAVEAIRASCPGVPVGVSTGAWISPDTSGRLSLIKGWEVTRMGNSGYTDLFQHQPSGEGRHAVYRNVGTAWFPSAPEADDYDDAALMKGYVAITPLHFDLTAFEVLPELHRWLAGAGTAPAPQG